MPARGVFGVGDVKDSPDGGAVLLIRLEAAVIHGELLEVGQDAEGQLRRPTVAAELEGGTDIILDVQGGLFGFEEKLSRAADAEAVVRRFGRLTNFDGVFVKNVFVGFGVALFVINIPAESFEERVEKLAAGLSFVVVARLVGVAIAVKAINEVEDLLRNRWILSALGMAALFLKNR